MNKPKQLYAGTILDTLFAPIGLEAFIAQYWQEKALVISERGPSHFDDIISVRSIDKIIENCCIPASNIDMGTNAVGAPPEKYKRHGYADAVSVAQRHREGETIILRSMHLFDSGLRDACSAISCLFRCPAQANVYLTPAGTRSSYPHWDAHDIIVLQLAGTKTWTLHENQRSLPHPNFRFNPESHPIGAKTGELILRPGDTAYIPRGLAHNPYANEYSVHVSIGIQLLTIYDVLSHAIEQLVHTDTAMRGAVPICQNGSGLKQDAFHAKLQAVIKNTLTTRTIIKSASKLLDRTAGQSIRSSSGNILKTARQPVSVDLNTSIYLPNRLPSRGVTKFGNTLRVLINGSEFEISPAHAEAIDFLVEKKRCCISDLPGTSDTVKIAFAEHLIREGCLKIDMTVGKKVASS